MKAEFKQTRIIDGQVFNKGTHEVPVELENHWYLKALITEGTVVMLDTEELKKSENSGDLPAAENDDPKIPTYVAGNLYTLDDGVTYLATDGENHDQPIELIDIKNLTKEQETQLIADGKLQRPEAPETGAEAKTVKTTITEPSVEGQTAEIASDEAKAKEETPVEYTLGSVYEFEGEFYLYVINPEGNEAFQPVSELTYEERHQLVSEGKLDASQLGEAPAPVVADAEESARKAEGAAAAQEELKETDPAAPSTEDPAVATEEVQKTDEVPATTTKATSKKAKK